MGERECKECTHYIVVDTKKQLLHERLRHLYPEDIRLRALGVRV